MLNWIIRNRTVWLFNCIKANDWCLVELLLINNNTWNHLTGCKRMLNRIISVHHHHHHHVVPLARISLILSRHFSLSFIASGRFSGLHPVSSDSCCMYVRAGRPAFARPYVGVHRSTSLIIFTNPSARAGYDTRSIFKRSLTGLNSEFSFS